MTTPEERLVPRKRLFCDVCGKRCPKQPRRVWRTPDDAFPLGITCSFYCALQLLKRPMPHAESPVAIEPEPIQAIGHYAPETPDHG